MDVARSKKVKLGTRKRLVKCYILPYRIKSAESIWRVTTGVMCDRNIQTKLINKVYTTCTAIKPAIMYGAEYWAFRKKEYGKLHTTKMRMMRWAGGNIRFIISEM